jgi:MOSC domain-containing protein YiiM
MTTVLAICAGSAIDFRGTEQSAIAKQPLVGKVAITGAGIAGDMQADLHHHGGPDMAVHHYPLDHHDFWHDKLEDRSLLHEPGSFGSNLATRGLTEGQVLLGDRFRLGTALLEACQPRQPCWKIEHRFGAKGMVKTIMRTGRCGWFYRVLEPGEAQVGDDLALVERGLPGWPMARVFEAIWGTSMPPDPELLHEVTTLAPLADKLRGQLLEKIG